MSSQSQTSKQSQKPRASNLRLRNSVAELTVRSPTLLCLLLALLRPGANAQSETQSAAWTGEWGSFRPGLHGYFPQPDGRGLTLSNCSGQHCDLSLVVQNDAGHGDAHGFAELLQPTEAIAHLTEGKQEYCTLRLTRNPQQPSITVRTGTGDCSYFLTPGASFQQTYPLHTRDIFVADDVASCFSASAPASLALCTDKSLLEQDRQWQRLFLEVEDLFPSSKDAAMTRERAAENSLASSCNAASEVKPCLTDAFAHSSAALQAREAAWLDSVTAPGDPGAARKAADGLRGTYRHSFQNGDVQGDTFLSTNTLKIDLRPDNSIHYNVHLEFYNGHECSIEGTARFRRAGFFVDQQKTDQPNFPLCVFELRATHDGVQLVDPTGACKMTTCGMRGGYNGAEFLFKERR